MQKTRYKIDTWIESQPEYNGISKIDAMRRLMSHHGTPYFVACAIGVYEHAVRKWIKDRGWRHDGKAWIAPETKELA